MKLEKIIIVLGPPGSGKGTQSKLLVEKFGYAFFTMGDSLREAAASGSELGQKVKAMIDQGLIVTDDLAEEVATAKWASITGKTVMISEGFPRTPGQVAMMDRFIQEQGIRDLIVLNINADKQALIDRLIKRSKIEGRVDDADIKSIEKRFSEFNDKTAKIIEYYRAKGQVLDIDGTQPIEIVHQEIMNKLGL
jgi:adenylate kinase